MGSPLVLSPVAFLGDDHGFVVEVGEAWAEILGDQNVCVDPDHVAMTLVETAQENLRLYIPTETCESGVAEQLGVRQGGDPVTKGVRGMRTADDDG